ncbi:hypothetical protein BOTBODRAFT_348888 [Botryobasidium botryosum FD-172 SS1]|uniref:Uncharacterized protein n=1 Tax=Botryobasidium botryosum (strain FD-172 SS1) TaxID=930990 RepID=A0A067MS00_BOTB1|nr:hypothetical protein BOTBODRAFT_348888 [Botryobasidium botryosum FD-172 SS1]
MLSSFRNSFARGLNSRIPHLRAHDSLNHSSFDSPPYHLPLLHALALRVCAGEFIEPLRTFRSRSLFFLDDYTLTQSRPWARSCCAHGELKELKPVSLIWCFDALPTPLGASHDNGDLIWSHLTGLLMWAVSESSHPLNLAYRFPSVLW